MANQDESLLVPMTFNGIEVLAQATSGSQPGTEATSAAVRLAASFNDAETTIRAIAQSVAQTVAALRETAAAPSEVEVEFGIGVTLSGNAVLVAGSSEASLSVRLTYANSRSSA